MYTGMFEELNACKYLPSGFSYGEYAHIMLQYLSVVVWDTNEY